MTKPTTPKECGICGGLGKHEVMKDCECNMHFLHNGSDKPESKNPPLTNLEKIKAAWKMGWSAVIINRITKKEMHVLELFSNQVRFSGACCLSAEQVNNEIMQITGYKYMGELGGNEEIPEGQMFKQKNPRNGYKYGGHLFFGKESHEVFSSVNLQDDDGDYEFYDKSEIEPYLID